LDHQMAQSDFSDDQYRIEAWFEDIDLGAIHTISFSTISEDG